LLAVFSSSWYISRLYDIGLRLGTHRSRVKTCSQEPPGDCTPKGLKRNVQDCSGERAEAAEECRNGDDGVDVRTGHWACGVDE
jgi:hypothetical protein